MYPKNSADQILVRETNLSLVLRLIHQEAPISRAQLAVRAGLNKSTISSLVDDLLDRRLIHETGINSAGKGRPATLLEINPKAGWILGAELGVDFVAVVLTDFVGNILWRKQVGTDPAESLEKTLDQTLALVGEAVGFCRERKFGILGLGLATPGTVDLNEGVLIFAPNLHWHNVPFRKIFSEATGLKVYVENDANAAAIAEHLFGAARQLKDFIFVFAGVGLGGGLFLNGELYRGKNGYAGEIGHSPIFAEAFQNPCRCGNRGCWETYANQYSVIRRVHARLEVKRSSLIPAMLVEHKTPLSIPLIKQAADAGDSEAIDSFAEAGVAMGQGLAGLANVFNPEKIIIGGPLSIASDYLLPSIRTTVSKHALPEINQQLEIGLSLFGADASLMGAVAVVVDDILKNPVHVERR
jgi:glucokinase-like ROK family protein